MLRRGFAFVLATGLGGCTVPGLELEGRACPCLAGYVCVDGRCWSADASTPVSSDASTEACEFLSERPCGTDEGECAAGTQTCTFEGTWGDCEGSVGPATFDECDGKDNDCNGKTDENSAGACEKFLGVCAAARRDCVGGQAEVTCPPTRYGLAYEEVETACDGKDNDCDGETDEGITGSECEKRSGVCAGAVRRCVGGRFEAVCASADYGSDYEVDEAACDGLDNDCDGETDEGIAPTGLCELQEGLCAGARRACVAGVFEVLCTDKSYPAGYHAAEVCDGLDDDCDGKTDDGFTCAKGSPGGACVTSCGTAGTEACDDSCSGYACAPPAESCNGIDEDCDASTDESLNSGFLQLLPATQSAKPAIAAFGPAGAGFATAWLPSGTGGEVRVQLVDPAPTAPVPGTANAVTGASSSLAPAVAGAFVGWVQPGKVRAAPLDPAGVPGAAFDLAEATDAGGLVAAPSKDKVFFAWTDAGKARWAAVQGPAQVTTGAIPDLGITSPTVGAVDATRMVVIAESAGGLVVADLSVPNPSFSSFHAATSLRPSATDGAVVFVMPSTCTPCPPGHASASRVVIASIGATTPVEPGVVAYLTEPASAYAADPKIAKIGTDTYVVAYRVLDGAGKATLRLHRVRFSSGTWTAVTEMTLTRPGTIASAALAFDGVHVGLVLDENEAGVFRAQYRTTCP